MADDARTYLQALEGSLHVDPQTRSAVMSEVSSHVAERREELESEGMAPEAAEERALRDFGNPKQIAESFYSVHAIARGRDMLLAVVPHLAIAGLFRFHLWVELFWVSVALLVTLAPVAIAWLRGLPKWAAPWLGYALVLPVMTLLLSVAALGYGAWAFFTSAEAPLSPAVYGVIAAWIPLCALIVFAVARRTISYDWLLGSLAALPVPFMAAWLFLLHWRGGALIPDQVRALETDAATAAVFVALAAFTALFMSVGKRSRRLFILLAATPPLIVLAVTQYHTALGLPTIIAVTALSLALVLSPILLDPTDRANLPWGRRAAAP